MALASCVAHYAGRFPERHHVDREHLRVKADFTMADDRPARVASIRLHGAQPTTAKSPRVSVGFG
ncbi:hypothetical protein [Streptomyces sp. NPDC020298]|uniref:hypothetical protein n=1 Tax=unclassified Streptomyces TaxID=2593676 RepID=UPI00340050AA